MSLNIQAVSGVKWNAVSQALKLSLYFITTLVLARLLDPKDFGLLGMATVFTAFITVFNDFGLGSAIIQNQKLNDIQLSTIFWLSVLVGLTTMIISLAAAPVVASFYNEPMLRPIIYLMSLSFIFSSLGQVQLALTIKSFSFKRLMISEGIASFGGSFIAITLALLSFGVWSLAFQIVITTGFLTIILWLTDNWKPTPVFEIKGLKKTLGFSSGLLSFNMLNYFSRNADYLLVGKFLGSFLLGHYTFAYRLIQFPLQNLSSVVSRVLFPTLSKLQDDDALFKKYFINASQFIAFFTFPLMICLFLLSEEFVIVLFGKKWDQAIPVIQILAPVGMLQSVGNMVGSIYTAKGKTNWLFGWGVLSSIVTVIFFIIGLRWGIVGVAAGYACATMLLIYPNFKIPFLFINLRFSLFLKKVGRQFLTAGLTGIFVYISISIHKIFEIPDIWVLLNNSILFFILYFFLALTFDRETLIGLVEAFLGKFSTRAKKYIPVILLAQLKKDGKI
jgi:O-antigen/teichoic acid export membrane protein